MKQLRNWIPFLLLLALVALFLKMPETPDFFGLQGCKACSSSHPYLPLIGAAYFATLLAASLLFPAFPTPLLGRAGLLGSIVLCAALISLQWPKKCPLCWIAHGCHLLVWFFWVLSPGPKSGSHFLSFKEKLYLALLAPIVTIALFSSLNLTFIAYDLKPIRALSSRFKIGDAVPPFTLQTANGLTLSHTDLSETRILNFVSPDCPYCKEQLEVLNALPNRSFRLIHISPSLPPDLIQQSPHAEWVEDRGNKLQNLFQVQGYPMMYVVGTDGKISQIVRGVPEELKSYLLENLKP